MSITANRWLAIVGGILLPSVEVVRRFDQLLDPRMFPAWFDDFLIGGLLRKPASSNSAARVA